MITDEYSRTEAEELDYRKRTAEAAEQFWSEVREYCETKQIELLDAKLAIRVMCGTPPWDAWSYVYPDNSSYGVVERKSKADAILSRDDIAELVKWAKARSSELYALDLKEWDWSFKDSELSLRLLIACSEEQLQKNNGIVTPNISSTMLGAIRELNKMYEYDGANYYADKARAVIFLHEDALED